MTKTLSGEPYAGFTDNLAQACTSEDEKRVSELVASWVPPPPSPKRKNSEPKLKRKEDVLLFQAIGIGNLPIIKYFMKRTKLTQPAIRTKTTDYILEAAVEAENIEVLDFLMLEYKWEINRPRFHHYAPHLGMAARTNNLKLIQWFLDHEADPNATKDMVTDQTPMSLAATANVETMEFMIKAGGDVNRGSPLHHAIRNQWILENGMVKYLLDQGADPNVKEYSQSPKTYDYRIWVAKDSKFGTPLHTAIAYFRFREIEPLLQYGADPTIKDVSGFTPMQRLQDTQAHIVKILAEEESKENDDGAKYKRPPFLLKRLSTIQKTIEMIEIYTKAETLDISNA